jgi:fucose permease
MHRTPLVVLLLAYVAFVSLGLPDTVLGVAWPSLRAGFGISQSAMGAVLAAGMSGYVLSGLLAGAALSRLGVGKLLSASSALVALGLLGFALAPSWWAFFPMGVLLGFGSGAIDSGLNGYSARHFSVRHVNWLHGFWGVGASLGPALMTAAIATGPGYRAGYGLIACVLGLMAVLFAVTRRRWDGGAGAETATAAPSSPAGAEAAPHETRARATYREALVNRSVWLQILIFFLYTGLEATAGQWCFSWMRERRGLSIEAAGGWTSAYWASLTFGRLALGSVIDRVGPERLLRLATFGAVAGAVAFTVSSGAPGRVGLLLLGMSLAPMFPTLMARTPGRVGERLVGHAIGFQVTAATLGSSLMPALTGVLVARTNLGVISGVLITLGLMLLLAHEVLLGTTRPLLSASSDATGG